MSRSKLWLLGGALVGLLAIVGGWFLLVSPERSSADELTTQAEDAQQRNQQLSLKLAQLRKEAETLPKLREQIAVIATQIPPEPQLSELMRGIQSIATAAGMTFLSITPTPPSPVTPAPAGAAGGAATKAPAAAVAGADTGLEAVSLTLTGSGTYANISLFVSGLETMRRAMLIQGLTISGTKEGEALNLNLQGQVFTAPDPLAPAADVSGSATSGSAGKPAPATTTAPAPTTTRS